jgi:LacI family transcriptional regulator
MAIKNSQKPPVSIKSVAARAEVSIGTVSNVLNRPEVVSQDKRLRVLNAVKELGYVRNDVARQLKAGLSRTVGLIIRDSSNPYYNEIAFGSEVAAEQFGQAVITGNAAESADRETTYLELFEEQRVRGVLITPQMEEQTKLEELRERGTPVVLIDEHAPAAKFCSLAVDDLQGGFIAVEHLLSDGSKKLAFVGGPMHLHQITDRLEGAHRAVAGVEGASLTVVETSALSVLEGRRAGEKIGSLPKSKRLEAIFAANDLLAIGLLQAFAFNYKIKVPEDITLIGYDDIAFTTSAIVQISSVRQPSRMLGETAIELLEDEISNPKHLHRHVSFQPEIVIRESTQRMR